MKVFCEFIAILLVFCIIFMFMGFLMAMFDCQVKPLYLSVKYFTVECR